MAKASRTISLFEEQMKNNVILEIWTQEWGLKVYPAYSIDKLKFSFIQKGAAGKGKSFDIYMECMKDGAQCFDNWAYDILHGRFERTMQAEAQAGEKYPKFYNYATGESAEKSVGIMNSTRGGYCINASVPGEKGKNYCLIPISYHDLRHLAERYLVSYKVRKDELEQLRCESARNWNKDNDADIQNNISETQNAVPAQKEAPKTAPAPEKVSENVQNNEPAKKEKKPTPPTTSIELKTASTLTDTGKGDMSLKAFDKKNNELTFVFPKEYWESQKYGKVGDQFKAKAGEKSGIMVTLHFFVYNKKNYVAKIGK